MARMLDKSVSKCYDKVAKDREIDMIKKYKSVKQIVFVRHGQSEYNVAHKFYGWHDPDLTDLGRQQAAEVAAKIQDFIEPEIVICSDLKRAVNTANPIAEKFGMEPVQFKSLREINHGEWEGLTLEEIENEHTEEAGIWAENPKLYRFPNGENYVDAYARARKTLDSQLRKHDKLILVAHYGTIDSLLSGIFFGDPVSDNAFCAYNASIIKFALIDGEAVLYYFNV